VAQIIGLGKDPLVEGEPGELAIDEAGLGMGVGRLDFDRLRAGDQYRSPDGTETGLFHTDPNGRVNTCHAIAVVLWIPKAPIGDTWRGNRNRATLPRRGFREPGRATARQGGLS